MAVKWKTVTTYPIADSQTLTSMDPLKISGGKVQQETSSLSQDIIGFSTQTISMGVLATVGQQEYVGVVTEGLIELTGLVEASGGTYTTGIAVGDTVSLAWDGGKPYAVKSSDGPIGRVVVGALAYNASADTTGTITIEIELAIDVSEIGAGAVGTAEIANGAVKGTKIGAASITLTQMGAGSVSGTKLVAGGVGTAQIADGSVKGTKIGAASVTLTQMGAGSVSGTKIVAGGVGTAQIADGSVKGTKIGAGSITITQMGDGAITGTKVSAGGISTAQIADGAVKGTKINEGGVGTAQIADGSVKGTKIGTASITITQMGNGSITGTKISAGGVGTVQIADGSVKGTKIGTGGVDTVQLAAAACTGTTLGADVVKGLTPSSYVIDVGGYVIGSTSATVVVDFTATLSGAARVFCQPLTATATPAIPSGVNATSFTVTGTNSQTGEWFAIVV